MTRDIDDFVAKRDRAYFCNDKNADILVAIHHNSYETDKSVDYSTVLYYKASDELLASNILSTISNQLNTKNQGISKFNDSLLWVAKMPAALTEAFFITNSSEYKQLIDRNSSRLIDEGDSIAAGVDKYFTAPDDVQATTDANSLIIDRVD